MAGSRKTKINREDILKIEDLQNPLVDELIGENFAKQLRDDVELIEGVYSDFDINQYLEGHVSPVFFGSAVNNFGVQELLDCFIQIAPVPRKRNMEDREVLPEENKFSGFVFKIHANIDPKHRNRIAFVRVCSGKFERTKNYYHVRLAKNFRFSNATAFMAQSKETIEEAFYERSGRPILGVTRLVEKGTASNPP